MHTIYVLNESPRSSRSWNSFVSSYVGSSDPTAQFDCVAALSKQLVVATTVYVRERYVALVLLGGLTGICCNEVMHVLLAVVGFRWM